MGCNDHQSAEHDHHAGESEHHDENADQHKASRTVTLNQAQYEYAGIETGDFMKVDLNATVKATGRLELPPNNKASVSPMIGGIVKSIHVIVGDYVKKGEVLAVLENVEYVRMQQDFLEAGNKLAYKQQEYQRQKTLYEDSVGSAKAYQRVASEYKALKARVSGLRRKLGMIGISTGQLKEDKLSSTINIRAPIGGYITEIQSKTGSFEGRHNKMFDIVDNHHIHIDLMVYEQDIMKVKKGQSVLFNFSNDLRATPLKARIFATGKALDQEQRAVRMHAEFIEKGLNLVPGMYTEALIVTDTVRTRNAIPEDAVIREREDHYIFVKIKAKKQAEQHLFKKISVDAGVTEKNLRQVRLIDTLPQHKGVVVKGAHYLQREIMKSTGGHQH